MESDSISQLSNSPLSQLKGVEPARILHYLTQRALTTNKTIRHSLRQKVFGQKIMQQTNYMSLNLQIRHFHCDYPLEQPFEAAVLTNCPVYHPWHINYIARTISGSGQLICPTCKTTCPNLGSIQPDALLLSVFEQAYQKSNPHLVFRRQRCQPKELSDVMGEAEREERVTVVDKEGEKWRVQTEVWQFSKDQSIEEASIEELASEIVCARGRQSQLYEKALHSQTIPLFVNLLCFHSGVRIINPLLHKLCRHEGKLILFSFEQTYLKISKEKGQKVECPVAGCPNYFKIDNFRQNGLVLPQLQRGLYRQDQHNAVGMLFGGVYLKNWHLNYIQGQTHFENKDLLSKTKYKVGELLTCASLREGATRESKIVKKMQTQKGLMGLPQGKVEKGDSPFVKVSLEPSVLCPVRCYKCLHLDAIDAFQIGLSFSQGNMRNCPLCGYELKKKQFYECFYIDLQLYQFTFLYGYAQKLIYNPRMQSYFYELGHYTGKSLKQYLAVIGRMDTSFYQFSSSKVILDPNKTFVPFIHEACLQKTQNQMLINHVVFVPEHQTLGNSLTCSCGRCLLPHSMLYIEKLEKLMLEFRNDLKRSAIGVTSHKARISSLESYKDIVGQVNLPQRQLIFYWRNLKGHLIRKPFIFLGCDHSFETSICDFQDITEQLKQGFSTFCCRYKNCAKEYEYLSDMKKVHLSIYATIQANAHLKKQIIQSNNYWLKYSGDYLEVVPKTPEVVHQESNYRLKKRERVGSSLDLKVDNPESNKKLKVENDFPSQVSHLASKSMEAESPDEVLELPSIKTSGNLSIFLYPVPHQQNNR